MNTDDDLLAQLGVELPAPKTPKAVECGDKPPKAKPVRFTEWSNLHTFEFGGYVARVIRHHCSMCDALWDELEGIFIEEVHKPSGSRRMTALATNGDWPAGGGHRKEVKEQEDRLCGSCVGALGFDREVDGKGMPLTMVVGKGVVR